MSNYYKLTATDKSVTYLVKNFTEESHRYSAEISIGFRGSKTYFFTKITTFNKQVFTAQKATKEEEYWIEECIKQEKVLTKNEFYESLKGRKFVFIKIHCGLAINTEFIIEDLNSKFIAKGVIKTFFIKLDTFFDDIKWVTEEKQKVSSVKQEYQEKVRGFQCVRHINQQQLFFIKTFLETLLNNEIEWYNGLKDFPSNYVIRFKQGEDLDLAYDYETFYLRLGTSKIWSFEEFIEIFDKEIKKYGLQEELHKVLHPESTSITKNVVEFISKSVDLEKPEKSTKNKDIFIRPVVKTKEKMDLTLENFTLKFVNIPISPKPVKKVPSIKVEVFKLNY